MADGDAHHLLAEHKALIDHALERIDELARRIIRLEERAKMLDEKLGHIR